MAMYDNLLANVPTDLWIGGKWKKSSDNARFDVIDPATESKIASVASASVDDAKAALDAAEAAFGPWAARKPRERGEILRKAYELIMRDAERLAKLITIENGKALSDSRGEVAYAAEFFRWYAEEAVRISAYVGRRPRAHARVRTSPPHRCVGTRGFSRRMSRARSDRAGAGVESGQALSHPHHAGLCRSLIRRRSAFVVTSSLALVRPGREHDAARSACASSPSPCPPSRPQAAALSADNVESRWGLGATRRSWGSRFRHRCRDRRP